jgi:ribose 5-phosphate isomerase B
MNIAQHAPGVTQHVSFKVFGVARDL